MSSENKDKLEPGARPRPPVRDSEPAAAAAPSADPAPTTAAAAAVIVPPAAADNSDNGGDRRSPAAQEQISRELPKAFALVSNLLCASAGLLALILLFESLSMGFVRIVVSSNGTVVYPQPSVTVASVDGAQIVNEGNVYAIVVSLFCGLIVCPLNIMELMYPGVFAKYREAQLVLNRIASGAHLANVIQAITTIVGYVQRWQGLSRNADYTAYRYVLGFWIFLLLAGLFQVLVHCLTPNEQERRFDRDTSMMVDDMATASYNHSPDRDFN